MHEDHGPMRVAVVAVAAAIALWAAIAGVVLITLWAGVIAAVVLITG